MRCGYCNGVNSKADVLTINIFIYKRFIAQRTPLHLAALSNSAQAVKILLEHRALHHADLSHRTPMELAVLYKKKEAAMVFAKHDRWKEFVIHPSRDYGSVVLGLIADLPEVMQVTY